jgi:hypothetical protein
MAEDNSDEVWMQENQDLVGAVSSKNFTRMSYEQQQRLLEQLAQNMANDDENEIEDTEPFAISDDDEDDPDYVVDEAEVASDVEDDLQVEVDPDEQNIDDSDYEEEVENTTTVYVDDFYLSKNKEIKWMKNEPSATRQRSHNVLRDNRSGPNRKFQSMSLIQIFKSFITEEMVDIIVRETNRKAVESQQAKDTTHPLPNKQPRVWQAVTVDEIYAVIGLLLVSGVTSSNLVHVKELWQRDGLPIYKATMNVNRFSEIMRYIRFDYGPTRQQRVRTDKAAAISDIWTMLNANLKTAYNPHEAITIDEQLFPYRGRTRFTQYIPSKPAKYGIKVWWACDSTTFFPLQGKFYTGKLIDEPREVNQGQNVVIELTRRYNGSGRTIIADNFFSTLNLCETLMASNLAFVGTVNKRKAFIPIEFLPHRKRDECSSLFGFYKNDVSLCSYVPKKGKAVVLMSSVHYTKETSGPKNKPAAIHYYNKYKCGVDAMDQMLTKYTTKRKTNRWPLAFFFSI